VTLAGQSLATSATPSRGFEFGGPGGGHRSRNQK
jgi:hypothetical protein